MPGVKNPKQFYEKWSTGQMFLFFLFSGVFYFVWNFMTFIWMFVLLFFPLVLLRNATWPRLPPVIMRKYYVSHYEHPAPLSTYIFQILSVFIVLYVENRTKYGFRNNLVKQHRKISQILASTATKMRKVFLWTLFHIYFF